jgi:hypothetical protein
VEERRRVERRRVERRRVERRKRRVCLIIRTRGLRVGL